jgi:hypothetical protein
MVTIGIGWKPSSLAGRAGLPVQKYSYDGGKSKKEQTQNRLLHHLLM